MKRIKLLFVASFFMTATTFVSCNSNAQEGENESKDSVAVVDDTKIEEISKPATEKLDTSKLNRKTAKYKSPAVEYYSNEPGNCPETGMELIKNPYLEGCDSIKSSK